MEALVPFLRNLSWPLAALGLLGENVVVFFAALVGGRLVQRLFRHRPITTAPPLTKLEVIVAVAAVIVNWVITVIGYGMWRAGLVRFRSDVGLGVLVDVLVLLLVMDLAMYILHRMAHVSWIYPILHKLHHKYEKPRPLTLFVLSPVETFSFGCLWLVVIFFYPSSWVGMSIYLTLNVLFGTIGHLGVEPFPAKWVHWPIARHVGTSTFHAQHHLRGSTNFGFYTLIWDRLFGTLHPEYTARFGERLDETTT